MKLYELSFALETALMTAERYAAEHEGELTDSLYSELEMLEGQKADKVLDICRAIKNLSAEAEAIGNEIKNLTSRKRTAERKAEWLKQYLATWAPNEKYQDSTAALSWRKSEKAIVDHSSEIPEEYTVVEIKPYLPAIKEAIKAGKRVPGAHVETCLNPQIK